VPEANSALKPIVKWAGGKRQILNELLRYVPKRFGTYYEPFFGGGSLFIALSKAGNIRKSVISDTNPDIYNLYSIVKEKPGRLIEELDNISYGNVRSDYYSARDEFNGMPPFGARRAALFLYLNRLGYNGLYRVNSKGKFNVPFGRYKTHSMPSREEILAFSEALRGCSILDKDFEIAVSDAEAGDLVYFDPPYMPVSNTAYFTDYTPAGFSYQDQRRLSEVTFKLLERGVAVIISNADTPEIRELYKSINVVQINARRSINSVARGRGAVSELIIYGLP